MLIIRFPASLVIVISSAVTPVGEPVRVGVKVLFGMSVVVMEKGSVNNFL